jgi:hypothetical protein
MSNWYFDAMQNIERPKPSIVFRHIRPSAPHVRDQAFVPVEPLLQRDLHARETVGIIRFVLFMVIAVLVFFIVVFGILGAIANAVGSGLGMHKNYPDVVGTH